MTTRTATKSVHATLSSTTADIVNLGNEYQWCEVMNRSSASTDSPLYTKPNDGTPPTAGADNTDIILPGQSLVIAIPEAGIYVVGNANPYSVTGVTV